MKPTTPLLFIAVMAVAGCGGQNGSSSGNPAPSLTLTADKAEVAYGEQVRISWNARNVSGIDEGRTNFPVQSAMTSSFIMDMPAVDTNYTVVTSGGGNRVERTVSVKVVKSAKRFALVTDLSLAGMPQVRDFLQGVTSMPVTTSINIPNLSGVDVLVLTGSGDFGPAQQGAVKAFLDSGKSVVLSGSSARRLATGSTDNRNLSTIGSWFGGVVEETSIPLAFGGLEYVDSRPAAIPVSSTVFEVEAVGVHYVTPLSAQAVNLSKHDSRSNAFAYKPASGGKVAYVNLIPTTASRRDVASRHVFLSLCRWAADGV